MKLLTSQEIWLNVTLLAYSAAPLLSIRSILQRGGSLLPRDAALLSLTRGSVG